MKQLVQSIKRASAVRVAAVALAIAGVATQAQAFTFGQGDLVVAVYGNQTEALYNLGQASTLLTSPSSTFDLSAGLAAAGIGTNPVKYTLFEFDFGSTSGQVMSATKFAPGSINTGLVNITNQFNPSLVFSSQAVFTGNTIGKADPKSFSSNLNPGSGTDTFVGTWPVAMAGKVGDLLNILKGDVGSNAFTQVGRALLAANGILTVGNPGPNPAPVPLPAGVVLFGTGLIGLVGIARRSFNRFTA